MVGGLMMLRPCLCAALAAVALCGPALADPFGPATPYGSFQPPKAAKGTVHVPVGSVVNDGLTAIPVPAGVFTPIDAPTQISCASKDGCTILIIATAEASSTESGNRWATCPHVDGNTVQSACFAEGYLLPIGIGGTVQGEYAVARGKHTVQTFGYCDQPCSIDRYLFRYDITTP
jgi:hypothetical protein